MDLKKIGKAIAGGGMKLLGGVVAGPAGAGVAGLVAHKLGLSADDEKGLLEAVSDPANAIKLRELENAHEEELERLQLRETELYLLDTQNARSREIEIVRTTGKRDVNLYVLSWCIVGGFFIMTGMLYFKEIPTGSIGPVNQLFGALTLAFGAVISYFFGSSAGSKAKTDILADQAHKNGGSHA